MDRRRWAIDGVAALVAAVVVVFAIVLLPGGHREGEERPQPPVVKPAHGPNIVFILTDDLSWNLVNARYMPHVAALERRGETFSRYFVTDSLCCPSRSTIFTGLFPHDTGVFTNAGRDGGYEAFIHHHPNLETLTYAVALRRHGYLTSMMGKYLNRYGEPEMTTHVPAGWTDWHVAGFGYYEFNYDLNENGRIVHYGGPAHSNYLTDVLGRRAGTFIGRAADSHRPFVMELATFAPHAPYIPAPRNEFDFLRLAAPRNPSFNRPNISAPDWLAPLPPLGPSQVSYLDYAFRRRVQADEAVDALLGHVQRALAARGMLKNTYIVFSSDNGYHLGQHRLMPGKETAFDSDIRVPLIVAGPGIPPHRVIRRVVQNTDLYPTILELAGLKARSGIDGHSIVSLLHQPGAPRRWRTMALIEHHGPVVPGDPDYDHGRLSGNPDSYEAIRISDRRMEAVYVEYRDGQHEYYDIARDPFEQDNRYDALPGALQRRLHRMLMGLVHCHGAAACWSAGSPQL